MNILFISLGCDKNLVDSEVMLGLLDKKGYQIVDSEEDADIIVVNTCCFIHDAKEESIQTILEMAEYKKEYAGLTAKEITDETRKRNEILAKEIYLSVGRYKLRKKVRMIKKLHEAFKAAMERGVDLNDEQKRNGVFDQATFRVRYLDETPEQLHGTCIINLAKIQDPNDWGQIRGKKIATVFQDPMTSLNPIITIGKQITSVIMKHQDVSEVEARAQALELMEKVGIPNAEQRFDDYPFQYSGGMRQRIVIAIALSCQPKILICDEPTTALDVTIQAQILDLMKDLQKKTKMGIIFITHNLGVVADICDKVSVMYAGRIVEQGPVDDIFYEPAHPYTKGLLRSMPRVDAESYERLIPIEGTPVDMLNPPEGCPFAPRCEHCMKICLKKMPPYVEVGEKHRSACWLCVQELMGKEEN